MTGGVDPLEAAGAVPDDTARAVTGGEGWRRGAGTAGTALGVAAVSAAAGVALERLTLDRGTRRAARLALDASGPYGALRGTPGWACAEDGAALYYEVDPAGEQPGHQAADRKAAGTAPPTVVFSHGYCLSQDSWHFQRAALRGRVRTVYWDQRGHGLSGPGRHGSSGVAMCPGRPERAAVSIDRLGHDLKAVLDAAAPSGPLILVGHSMGGMTMMALAEHYPTFVRERVVGIGFVGTSGGGLDGLDYGLPPLGGKVLRWALPGVLRALGSQPALVERGRRATSDLYAGVIQRYAFGARDVDPAVARFVERLIEATPIDVVAEFYPAFAEHDKHRALAVFDGLPAFVLSGERDLITPSEHGRAIAEAMPDAELTLVPGAGHLVLLERPETVCADLMELLARAGTPIAVGTSVADR